MVRKIAALLLLIASLGVVLVESNNATAQHTVTTTTEEPSEDVVEEMPIISCTGVAEVYNVCGPACGDRTCDNQGRSDVPCTKQCVEGCYCRSGYVRNKAGTCILPYRCGRSA
ncbi:AGAP006813-PA-like protein [Anopheles sinensis]|uniref:AGAP006813-PA-like protein n=1 Tax=Anopheles sinensis TaxID=74873 RepID=A0A084WMU6_ANOSI|nr:AGAP006813-PA-like protein [Anopheles sinensis]